MIGKKKWVDYTPWWVAFIITAFCVVVTVIQLALRGFTAGILILMGMAVYTAFLGWRARASQRNM